MNKIYSVRMKLRCIALSFAWGVVASNVAKAGDTDSVVPRGNTTSVETPVLPERSLLDHFYLNYFATYHGAPLSGLWTTHTLDNNGNPGKSSLYLDSEVTTAYMINSDIGIGPDIPFLLLPTDSHAFVIGDVGVKFFDRKTFSTQNSSLYTNLILQVPSSTASQGRHLQLGVKTTPAFFYNFPNSRFAAGAWSELKAYLGVTDGKTFKIYGAPYVKYQLTKSLALNIEYEIELHHDVGTPTLAFGTYQSDFEPGVVWNITNKIVLNPYLQFFTNNKITMNTAALGAIVSATLL